MWQEDHLPGRTFSLPVFLSRQLKSDQKKKTFSHHYVSKDKYAFFYSKFSLVRLVSSSYYHVTFNILTSQKRETTKLKFLWPVNRTSNSPRYILSPVLLAWVMRGKLVEDKNSTLTLKLIVESYSKFNFLSLIFSVTQQVISDFMPVFFYAWLNLYIYVKYYHKLILLVDQLLMWVSGILVRTYSLQNFDVFSFLFDIPTGINFKSTPLCLAFRRRKEI